MATRLEGAIARVIAAGKVHTYNMSGGRGDTDSPHHGGQAVARAATHPRSMLLKPSRATLFKKSDRKSVV